VFEAWKVAIAATIELAAFVKGMRKLLIWSLNTLVVVTLLVSSGGPKFYGKVMISNKILLFTVIKSGV